MIELKIKRRKEGWQPQCVPHIERIKLDQRKITHERGGIEKIKHR